MEALYEKLRVLQEIIHERFSLEHELEELPRNLAKKLEVLNRNRKNLAEIKQKLEDYSKKRWSLSDDLRECSLRKEHLEKQMDNVKTQKEYESLDKEIKEATEKEQSLRRELNALDREIEQYREEEKKHEAHIEINQREFEEESQKMAQIEADRKRRVKELEARENEITPDLDPDMLFKFKRIIKSKQGIGIVAIRNGVCTGCHMILPMQFVNDVRKGDQVRFCPYCSRVLYFESDQHERRFEPSMQEAGSLVDVLEEN